MFIPFDTQPELTPDNIIMAKTAHGDATINRTQAIAKKDEGSLHDCASRNFPNANESISRSTFVDNLDNVIPGKIKRHAWTNLYIVGNEEI